MMEIPIISLHFMSFKYRLGLHMRDERDFQFSATGNLVKNRAPILSGENPSVLSLERDLLRLCSLRYGYVV